MLIATAVMAVVLAIAPHVGIYPVFLMKALCFALFACAFNLLLGFGGLLSFGHAMFLGIAGYVSAHAAKVWGFPPELAIVAGTAASAVLGLVAGALAIRRQGIYFAMITLALAQMIFFFCLQAPFTHGEDGIQAVPRGKLFGVIDLSNTLVMYYVVLAIFLAAFLLIFRVIHSPFGNVLKAIRENEPRAISLGYDAERYKLLAFVLSATLAGLAGATKAIVFQLASLTDVHWTMSGEVVLMTLLGRHGDDLRAGRRRVRDHRPRKLSRGLRPVGDRDHRRDLRRLRARVPARHRGRDRRVVGKARALTVRWTRRHGRRGDPRRMRPSHRRHRRISSPTSRAATGAPNGAYELRIAGRAPADSRRVRQRPADGHVPVLGVDRRAHRRHSVRRRRQGRHGRGVVRAGHGRRASLGASSRLPTPPARATALTRSWHANGRRRSEYLYERGNLTAARRGTKPALRWPSPRRAGSRSAISRRMRNSSRASSGRSPRTAPRCD